jgi:single-strand DNA-binding protein
MALSLNKAQVIGNLTRDPELRQTPSGQSVGSFVVATNFSWVDQEGNKQEKVEFHNIVVWRKLAEICAQYLKKGSKVFIEGRLQTRDWEGEDGVKRYKTEIIGDNMIMLTSQGGNNASSMSSNSAASSMGANVQQPAAQPVAGDLVNSSADISIDDLPF